MLQLDETKYVEYRQKYSYLKLNELFEYDKEEGVLRTKKTGAVLNTQNVFSYKRENFSTGIVIKTLVDKSIPRNPVYKIDVDGLIKYENLSDKPKFKRRERNRDLPKGVSIRPNSKLPYQAHIYLPTANGTHKLYFLGNYLFQEDAESVYKLSLETGRPIRLSGKYFKF